MNIDVEPDWWKSLFDEIYLKTDARSVGDETLTGREIDIFSELIPLRPEQRVLDLCGGHGRHSIELCRRGFRHCVVLDYSRSLLCKGAENTTRRRFSVRFVQSDARDTALADKSFDHVLVVGNSLGYAPGRASDLQILTEAHRVLMPGGWLLVDVADGAAIRERFSTNAWHEIGTDTVVCRQRQIREDAVFARELVLSKAEGMIRDRTYRVRIYGAADLKHLLREAGFGNIRVHTRFQPFESSEDVGFMNCRMVATARKP